MSSYSCLDFIEDSARSIADITAVGAIAAGLAATASALDLTAFAVDPLSAFIFTAAVGVVDQTVGRLGSMLAEKLSDLLSNDVDKRNLKEGFLIAFKVIAVVGAVFAIAFLIPELAIPAVTGVFLYSAASLIRSLLLAFKGCLCAPNQETPNADYPVANVDLNELEENLYTNL